MPVARLREVAIDALLVLTSPQQSEGERGVEPDAASLEARPAWASVEATRRRGRPGLRELLRHGAQTFIPYGR